MVVVLFFLLACGGEPEAALEGATLAEPALEPVVEIDSPFCPSFEACMEGLPSWGAECDRWHAGDPDCAPMDWSEGPADWIDETQRGIAALLAPGRAPEADATLDGGPLDSPVTEKPASEAKKARIDVPATTKKPFARKE